MEDKDIFSVSSRGALEGQYDVALHLKESVCDVLFILGIILMVYIEFFDIPTFSQPTRDPLTAPTAGVSASCIQQWVEKYSV